MKNMKITIAIALIAVFALFSACGGGSTPAPDFNKPVTSNETEKTTEPTTANADPMTSKGIGPIKSLELSDEIDQTLVDKGIEVYKANCTACHKFDKRVVGPALAGITTRRTPEWIMNMMLNPEEMVEKDPLAKALLEEYLSPMANQNLTEEEARAILELFRTKL